MAILHAEPGRPVDVRSLGAALANTQTTTLFKTDSVEAIRMVLPKGKIIADHKAPGEIIVQCLEGRIAFTAMGSTSELEAGRLLFLPAGELHSVQAMDDTSLLLTIVLKR